MTSSRSEPTLDEVIAYAKEINSPTSPERFYRHYSGKNWRTSHGRIVDWKAIFRLWTDEDRRKKFTPAAAYKHGSIDKEKLKRILRVFPDAAEGVELPSSFWE